MQAATQTSVRVPVPPRFFMSGEGETPKKSSRAPGALPSRAEDLPYRVEVWDADSRGVEQTLAMTANGSIGYAAYYEATREYPDRLVVLRHKDRIVARSNPPDS